MSYTFCPSPFPPKSRPPPVYSIYKESQLLYFHKQMSDLSVSFPNCYTRTCVYWQASPHIVDPEIQAIPSLYQVSTARFTSSRSVPIGVSAKYVFSPYRKARGPCRQACAANSASFTKFSSQV